MDEGAVVLSRLAVLIERTAAIVEKLNNARESSRTPMHSRESNDMTPCSRPSAMAD